VAENFLLRLLTPYESVFEDEVEAVIVPGEGGEFGVLARHTKYITVLAPGALRYVKDGQTRTLAVSGGFAEVHPGGVTVLADSMERPGDIDVERARKNRDEAMAKLKDKASMEERQVARWEDRVARAENRLRVAKSA
jgi:F-type H+-transporting ATPase subunit epsilon